MAAKACLAVMAVMAATVHPELPERKARAGDRVRSHFRCSAWVHPREHSNCSGGSFGGQGSRQGALLSLHSSLLEWGEVGCGWRGVSQPQGIRNPGRSTQICTSQEPGSLEGLGMAISS